MAPSAATPPRLPAATTLLTAAAAAAAAVLLLPGEARADGGTAASLVSRENAIQNATLWMPPGARITSTDCTEMLIDSSPRYVCTVEWGPADQ
jgi:hypothetical protein